MSSIDALLTRAKRLQGVNDDVLEEQWDQICEAEAASLIADLEAQIANMTPEEREAEQQNDPSSEEFERFCAEMEPILAQGAEETKAYWMEQQRRKRRRHR